MLFSFMWWKRIMDGLILIVIPVVTWVKDAFPVFLYALCMILHHWNKILLNQNYRRAKTILNSIFGMILGLFVWKISSSWLSMSNWDGTPVCGNSIVSETPVFHSYSLSSFSRGIFFLYTKICLLWRTSSLKMIIGWVTHNPRNY